MRKWTLVGAATALVAGALLLYRGFSTAEEAAAAPAKNSRGDVAGRGGVDPDETEASKRRAAVARVLARAVRRGDVDRGDEAVDGPGARVRPPSAAARAGGRAERVGSAGDTASRPLAADVTPEERAVLDVYAAIGSAFEVHPEDCPALATQVERLIESKKGAFQDFARSRGALAEEERSALDARFEEAARSELERLRQTLRVGVSRCANEARLRDALRSLAALGQSS